MPEGPEILTMSKSLHTAMSEKYIFNISYDDKLKCNGLDKLETPIKVSKVSSYGKKIIIHFEHPTENTCLIIAPLMTGIFTREPSKHNHAKFDIVSSIDKKIEIIEDTIYYSDVRCFGLWNYTSNTDEYNSVLKKVGLDILKNTVSIDDWDLKVKKYGRKSIREVLMNQSIYSGIGNYLVSDICYVSRVHPHELLRNLDKEKTNSIFENIKNIMWESVEHGGMSMRDYKDLDGKLGTYNTRIYGKKTTAEGYNVIPINSPDGRVSWVAQDVQILI